MGRGARSPSHFVDIDGILLLNKPLGLSSNQVLQKVRHLFKANKAGHTGSLDPLATGMLPICFGEATKFSSYLLDARKSYRALLQLGKTSSTGDAEGEITSERPVEVAESQLEEVLKQFTGIIKQIPPMHSAVKIKGQRLYKLARKGKEIERAARKIEIHDLKLVAFNDDQICIDVVCSKGTYIRTLAEDIGEALNCGAFLASLERTGVHPFWQQRCYKIEELEEFAAIDSKSLTEILLPVSAALSDLPESILDDISVDLVKQGRAISVDSLRQLGLLKLVSENGQFIGIGEARGDGRILPKRLMNTAT